MKLPKNYLFTVNIERGEDNHFVVSVPALPGCFSQGDTYEEAVAMAEDTIRGYLQLALEKGKSIPVEKRSAKRVMLNVHFPIPMIFDEKDSQTSRSNRRGVSRVALNVAHFDKP